MLQNSPTLAISAPINVSIKLGFVSVNGPRETFVEAIRRYRLRGCGKPYLASVKIVLM